MQPTQELVDALFREEVLRAREMTPDEKARDGVELFEQACEFMRCGIRHEFPDAEAEEVERILTERFKLLDKLETGD